MPETGQRPRADTEDAVRSYLHDISGHPLLTAADEERLARSIAEGREASKELEEGDGRLPPERRRYLRELVARCEQSTRQFVEANLRLVVSIAKRYRHPRVPLPDLIQEGNMGLLQAVRKFDHTKGFRFSTYATWWIRQAITRSLANTGRLIRLPVEAGDRLGRIRGAAETLEAELGRPPTVDELAAAVRAPARRVVELLESATEPISVSQPVGDDGGELGDTIADPAAAAALEESLASLVPSQVERLLGSLDERERQLLCLRYGLDGEQPRSRAAVGEVLGISGERIRQVEARALARLRGAQEAREAWAALRG